MNEKIQAILLKIVVTLKKDQWQVSPNWEITLKSEGHVPLTKSIPVKGNYQDEDWTDAIDTTIDLKLDSTDEITFYPGVTIYASIFLKGAPSHDIAHKTDVSVAFTEKDFSDPKKAEQAARRISRQIQDYIENEYDGYVNHNGPSIKNFRQGDESAEELE